MKKGTRIGTFDRGDHVMPGPRGLLAGVLLRSIDDARTEGRHREHARAWIASDRVDHPFAFVRVAETLDLDPRRVRKMIFRLPPAPPTRPDPYQDDELDPEEK